MCHYPKAREAGGIARTPCSSSINVVIDLRCVSDSRLVPPGSTRGRNGYFLKKLTLQLRNLNISQKKRHVLMKLNVLGGHRIVIIDLLTTLILARAQVIECKL